MVWALVLVAVLLSCTAVVAVMVWRTYTRVRALARTVAAASERIADASAALEDVRPPVR